MIISQNETYVHMWLSWLKYGALNVEMLDMLTWFNVYFLLNKFNQLSKGYDLVDHEIFCIVTNEGGAFISVVGLVVVVNTNICSWVTHSGRGSNEYLKVIWTSSVGNGIYIICRLCTGVHCAITFTSNWHASLTSTWSRDAIKVSALSNNNKKNSLNHSHGLLYVACKSSLCDHMHW